MIKQLYSIFLKDGKSKKLLRASKPKRFLIYLGIFLIFTLITTSIIYGLVEGFVDNKLLSMLPLDFGNIALIIGLFFNFVVVLISGLSFLFSSCYLDKNLNNYITLPLKARDFTIAKVMYIYTNSMLISSLVMIPTLALYIILGSASFFTIIIVIFSIFTLPIILIYIEALILVTLLYFINKMNNKRIAKNLLYIISMVFFIGIYLYFVFLVGYSPTGLITIILKLRDILSIIFFYPLWTIRVFGSNELIYLLYMIIAVILSMCIQFYFEKLYFKSSVGFNNEDYRLKKKVSKNKVTAKSTFKWFFIKESKEILKTPVYFLNTIFSNIFIVIIFLIILGFNYYQLSTNQTKELIKLIQMFNTSDILLVVVIVATIASFFNTGAASIFSRDIKDFPYIKTLPIKYTHALSGKLFFHLLVDIISVAIFVVIPLIFFKVNIITIILSVLLVILIATTTVFIPICIDLRWPNLSWDSQTDVVKRSKSIPLSMLAHFIFAVLILGIGLVLFLFFELSTTILLFIAIALYLVLILLFYKLFIYLANRAYQKY